MVQLLVMLVFLAMLMVGAMSLFHDLTRPLIRQPLEADIGTRRVAAATPRAARPVAARRTVMALPSRRAMHAAAA